MVPEELPGELVTDFELLNSLKYRLADVCHLQSIKFPGSQPVSFDLASLELLEKEDFWVCEKSDGVRVLVLILATDLEQEIYLVDRKEEFYRVYGLRFPHHEDDLQYNHSDTVLDGEMVIDIDPATNLHVLRLLAFDLLVCDSKNLMSKPLSSRYGKLAEWVMTPYKQLLKREPHLIAQQPFEVLLKPQERSYGIEAVFKEHLPKLQHGNDGLIFTSAEASYTPGTDPKILKWKPPSENSIDFVLQLKFPALPGSPEECDFTAKPYFMLMMNHGRDGLRFFDTMDVKDDEWENWKRKGEQYDDRVVEVVWDKERQTWKMLRFRDDKREGNYKTVVTSILRSIEHGVEADELIAHAGRIKHAWKMREQRRAPPPAQNGARQAAPMPQSAQRPQPPRQVSAPVASGLKR